MMNLYDAIIAGKIAGGGGGGSGVTVEPLTVTENGTYSEEGKAYSPVTVNIKSDIEKIVSESEWWDDSYLENITVEGNPLEINSPLAQNAISTLLSFSPKQSGSGTPSPQNVRPIEGWTEYDLTMNENRIVESLGGTYYGFTVNLENGTAEINYALIDMGDMNYSYNSDTLRFTNTTLAGSVKKPLTNDDVVPMICESYKTDKYNEQEDFAIACGTSGLLSIRNSNYTSPYKFKQSVRGVFLAYPLDTPQTIPLTPQTVALLKGNNTLWTDGDNISLTYRGEHMNAPLLGMLGNAVLTQNNVEESELTDEESNISTEEEENVSE